MARAAPHSRPLPRPGVSDGQGNAELGSAQTDSGRPLRLMQERAHRRSPPSKPAGFGVPPELSTVLCGELSTEELMHGTPFSGGYRGIAARHARRGPGRIVLARTLRARRRGQRRDAAQSWSWGFLSSPAEVLPPAPNVGSPAFPERSGARVRRLVRKERCASVAQRRQVQPSGLSGWLDDP